MSAVFTQTVAQRLTQASNPLTTGNAFTMAFWFKTAINNADTTCFSIGSSSTGDGYLGSPSSGGTILFMATEDYLTTIRDSYAGPYATDAWGLFVGISNSASHRQAFYNNANDGNFNNVAITLTGLDSLCVGASLLGGSFFHYFTGRIAEVALWDIALDGTQRSALWNGGSGAGPETVASSDLLFHEQLYSGAGVLTNTGTVTFDTADHPIARSAITFMRPDATSAAGNWLTDAGASTLHLALDETSADDNDYIISGANPTADTCKIQLSNLAGITETGYTVRYRYYKQETGGTGTMNLRVRLLEGTTERATWTHNNISTTPTTATQSVSGAEFSAITDPDNLFLEFTANP